MAIQPEDILKLMLALALGGSIGAERELRDKAAGFRTLMFICAGSAMFTIFSARLAVVSGVLGDPTRVAAQIVSGIGFLGAGVILREHGEIRGLTTAAMIWLVAALGMGVGGGEYILSIVSTAVVLLALLTFPALEHSMSAFHQVRTYSIRVRQNKVREAALQALFLENDLHIFSIRQARKDKDITYTWLVTGKRKSHEIVIAKLMQDEEIQEVEV